MHQLGTAFSFPDFDGFAREVHPRSASTDHDQLQVESTLSRCCSRKLNWSTCWQKW
ncbi:MAG: hypothetical protein M5U34_44030 [Chloroflexi bacterium]|nr:hypothetical protein [Chloroflexota bacterium]